VESLVVVVEEVQPLHQLRVLVVLQLEVEVVVDVEVIKQPHLQHLWLVQPVVRHTHTQSVEVEQLD
jgi:hypothetical protein